jgi:hypothetical protein
VPCLWLVGGGCGQRKAWFPLASPSRTGVASLHRRSLVVIGLGTGATGEALA